MWQGKQRNNCNDLSSFFPSFYRILSNVWAGGFLVEMAGVLQEVGDAYYSTARTRSQAEVKIVVE